MAKPSATLESAEPAAFKMRICGSQSCSICLSEAALLPDDVLLGNRNLIAAKCQKDPNHRKAKGEKREKIRLASRDFRKIALSGNKVGSFSEVGSRRHC